MRVEGDPKREVRNCGLIHVVVRAYRISRPQPRVLKAMGKCTSAGWIG